MTTPLENPKLPAESTAANEDHVGGRIVVTPAAKNGLGWDAFEVWRRLVRDARDQRAGRQSTH